MERTNEDEIESINRLLGWLHQADYKALGSIEINIYKQGSQHVDRVENQYFGYPAPSPAATQGGEHEDGASPMEKAVSHGPTLPRALSSETAMTLWRKVQEAGYVDENFQPLISRTQSAVLADEMARQLGIKEKWKVFGTLWDRKNMRNDYYDALNQRKTLDFQDKLKDSLR